MRPVGQGLRDPHQHDLPHGIRRDRLAGGSEGPTRDVEPSPHRVVAALEPHAHDHQLVGVAAGNQRLAPQDAGPAVVELEHHPVGWDDAAHDGYAHLPGERAGRAHRPRPGIPQRVADQLLGGPQSLARVVGQPQRSGVRVADPGLVHRVDPGGAAVDLAPVRQQLGDHPGQLAGGDEVDVAQVAHGFHDPGDVEVWRGRLVGDGDHHRQAGPPGAEQVLGERDGLVPLAERGRPHRSLTPARADHVDTDRLRGRHVCSVVPRAPVQHLGSGSRARSLVLVGES